MANDPVLQRSMFQKQGQSVAPSVGLGGGLGSMSTPDQNAQALRSMFQPTVSLGMPTQMLQQEQQPIQSFQEGGFATPLVAQYDWRNQRYQNPPSYAERTDPAQFEADRPAREAADAAEKEARAVRYAAEADRYRMLNAQRRQAIDDADALTRYPAPKSQFRRDVESVLPSLPTEERVRKNMENMARMGEARKKAFEEQQSALEEYRKGSPGSPVGDYFRSLTPEEAKARAEERAAAAKKLEAEGARIGSTFTRSMDAVAPRRSGIASVDMSSGMGGGEAYSPEPSRSIASQMPGREAPVAAPAREKGILELTLEGIKEERARTAEDKKQNALLALMQAGFAMAAGRSPNAISNIGAGGQAGIAAFAELEKGRREEQAALRRDEMSIRLAQAKLAEDPETVKLFKALGAGDLMKGFDIYNADKKLQAANETRKDFRSTEEDLRIANEYIRSRLASGTSGSSLPTVRLAPNQGQK